MANFNKLNDLVIDWANDKGILDKATPLTQISKTEEEVAETREALFALQNGLRSFTNCKGKLVDTEVEVKDGLGDIFVTLLIGCKLSGLDPLDCLETAYNVIKSRTGIMKGGKFIKD